jgi:hypothetical protein
VSRQGDPQPPAGSSGQPRARTDRTAAATLLSALVLPGLGHIYLKRYRRAAIILLVLAAGFALLLFVAIGDALALSARLQLEADILDVDTILSMARETYAAHAAMYRGCILYIVAVWLFSIVDTWRIGKRAAGGPGTS